MAGDELVTAKHLHCCLVHCSLLPPQHTPSSNQMHLSHQTLLSSQTRNWEDLSWLAMSLLPIFSWHRSQGRISLRLSLLLATSAAEATLALIMII